MSGIPNIAAALDHPGMFEPWFRGSSWNGWRAIIKAAHALPMTAEETAFFKSVAGDRDPPMQRVKELWVIAGRRSGKDSAASVLAAHAAAVFQPSDNVRGGERPIVMCLSADRENAKTVLGYTRDYFAKIPPLKAMVTRETQWGVELDNGVDISISTADYRSVRGRTVLTAILDEVSFWLDETSSNPDVEIYRALRPGLATLPGSMLIGITSAYRRAGLAYARYEKHFGQNDQNVLVVLAETRALNPLISQQTIDDALGDDPESAKAEYLSIWRDDLSSYITRIDIERCVDVGTMTRQPMPGMTYYGFVDASSLKRDSFTGAVAHAENDRVILDHVVEIPAGTSNPAEATALIASVLKNYGIREAIGDRYALGYAEVEFARHGITLQHSDRDRSKLYRECLPLLLSGKVRLLDHPKMVAQFAALETRALPGGNVRIDHPRSGSDDISNAVAGAIVTVGIRKMTSGDNWCEVLRRQLARGETDVDDIRAPGPTPQFGYGLTKQPEPQRIEIEVPKIIADATA
jgi:hypothetical protein